MKTGEFSVLSTNHDVLELTGARAVADDSGARATVYSCVKV